MNNHGIWGTLFVLLLFTTFAHAQASRTWVSGVGDDANPCSRTAPCKTFAGAISKTAAGGEIDALDPGGYGAVTITKAITIDGGGTFASVLVSGTNGIVVAAGANDIVTLRNLTIDGLGTGIDGIYFTSGNTLNVQNIVIFNFSGDGIGANKSSSGSLNVDNVSINNCSGAGISVLSSFPPLGATISRAKVQSCHIGVTAGNGSVVSIRDSDLSLNSIGLLANSPNTQANVDTVRFASNAFGITAAGGVVRFMNSTFFSNGLGINPSGGSICSVGDSIFAGNGTNGIPSANIGVCTVTVQ
jgi:hypothetical protein